MRQCGKTYILKEFGKNEFQSVAYISCDRNDELDAIYEGGFNVSKIIRGISALTHTDIIPGKTLIFLDEIQAFPKALEALKYFCEDAPEYHIVGLVPYWASRCIAASPFLWGKYAPCNSIRWTSRSF